MPRRSAEQSAQSVSCARFFHVPPRDSRAIHEPPPMTLSLNEAFAAHEAQATWLRAKAAESPAPWENKVIVTHYPNIAEAFPEESKGLVEGEALILHPDGRRGAPLVARVKLDEWAALVITR